MKSETRGSLFLKALCKRTTTTTKVVRYRLKASPFQRPELERGQSRVAIRTGECAESGDEASASDPALPVAAGPRATASPSAPAGSGRPPLAPGLLPARAAVVREKQRVGNR